MRVDYVSTEDMLADVLTEPLPLLAFSRCIRGCGAAGVNSYSPRLPRKQKETVIITVAFRLADGAVCRRHKSRSPQATKIGCAKPSAFVFVVKNDQPRDPEQEV